MAFSREVWMRSLLAPLGMLLTQIIMTGMLILSKIILNRGTFVYSFLAYRSIIGALAVLPFAFFIERDMLRKLSWRAFCLIFINAITGITIGIGFYYYGLRDTTATYSSCFYNMIPIVTFFLSIVSRAERLGFGTIAGKFKILGALISVGGAMIITLLRGKKLYSNANSRHGWAEETRVHHWVRGTIFLIGSCFSDAFWYIGQVELFKIYPSKYWATTLTCAVGSVQSALVGVILNRTPSAWKLGWDLQLLTTVYSGVLTTGLLFCVTTWVTTIRGPTYSSMFNSLSLIFVAIIETLFMGQELTIGSLLGIVLIIGGLCAFLWGRGRESPQQKEKNPQEVEVKAQEATV